MKRIKDWVSEDYQVEDKINHMVFTNNISKKNIVNISENIQGGIIYIIIYYRVKV